MSSEGSVTHWIDILQGGDRAAVGPLWQRYFGLLVTRARAALGAAPRRAADEEDVALGAFDSFCRGVEQGRFPRLLDRDNLWQLLVVITARKAVNLLWEEAGGSSLFESTDMQRLWRDANAAAAHHGLGWDWQAITWGKIALDLTKPAETVGAGARGTPAPDA